MNNKIVLVQYNIPHFVVAMPGKPNRACTGEMNIVVGVANPFSFQYSNTDDAPLNLSDLILRLVFWFPQHQYESLSSNLRGNIVLAKDLVVDDVYKGTATLLLSEENTLTIARLGRSLLRWSMYIIDKPQGNTFTTQITSDGGTWGMAHLIIIPRAESIYG